MSRLLHWVFVGTTFASAAGLLGYLTSTDLYTTLTGVKSQQVMYRLHGLNYEPRGLGLIAAYGTVVCVAMLAQRFTVTVVFALLVDAAALFTAVSISAVGAAAVGLLALAIFQRGARVPLILAAVGCLSAVVAIGSAQPHWAEQWTEHFAGHEVGEVNQSGSDDRFTRVAVRAGAFDAPALLFLRDHPGYALVGTGPELIVVPDTEEAAKLPLYHWLWEQDSSQGIVVPPTIGVLYQIANGGAIGLGLIIFIVAFGWRSLLALATDDSVWGAAAGVFIASFFIYSVQVSTVSAIPYLMLAPGIAADRIVNCRTARRQASPSGYTVPVVALRSVLG